MAKSAKDTKSEKTKISSIDELKRSLEKSLGSGIVMQGNTSIVEVEVFPTRIPSLDLALGCLGIPVGRIIELFGSESSGKTTTCLHIIEACQKHYFKSKERFGRAVFIDAEHAFDPVWARKLGVNLEELITSQPESAEDVFTIVERMIESEQIDLIVVDSVAALTPRKILEGDIDETTIGALARIMSTGLNKIKAKASMTQTSVIFINQIREKVGVMFGSPETTPGGRALKFYSSLRIQINKGSAIKSGDTVIGFQPTAKIIKNKVAPPFTIAEYDILFGQDPRPINGIDKYSSLLKVARECKVVSERGTFLNFEGTNLGAGMNKCALFLRENPEIHEKIYNTTYEAMLNKKESLIDKSQSVGKALEFGTIDDSIEETDE